MPWVKRPKKNPAWYRKQGNRWVMRDAARASLNRRRKSIAQEKAARRAKARQIQQKRDQEAAYRARTPTGTRQFSPNPFDDYGYTVKRRGPNVGGFVVTAQGKPIWQGQQYPNPEDLPKGLIDAIYKRYGVDPNMPYINYPAFARERLNSYDVARGLHQSFASDVQQWATNALNSVQNQQGAAGQRYEESMRQLPDIAGSVHVPNVQVGGVGGAVATSPQNAQVAAEAQSAQAGVTGAQGEAAINRFLGDTQAQLGNQQAQANIAQTIAQIPYFYNQQKMEYMDNINRFLQEIEQQEALLEFEERKFQQQNKQFEQELGFQREELGARERMHGKDIALGGLQAQYGLIGDLTQAGVSAQNARFDRQIALGQLDLEEQRLQAELDAQRNQAPEGTLGPFPTKPNPVRGIRWEKGNNGQWYGIPFDPAEPATSEPVTGTGGAFIPGNGPKPKAIPGRRWVREPNGWRSIPIGPGQGGRGGRGPGGPSLSEKRQQINAALEMWYGKVVIDPNSSNFLRTERTGTGIVDMKRGNKQAPAVIRIGKLWNLVMAMTGNLGRTYNIVNAIVGRKNMNKFERWSYSPAGRRAGFGRRG